MVGDLLPPAWIIRSPKVQDLPYIQKQLNAWDMVAGRYGPSASEEVRRAWKHETFTLEMDAWVVLASGGEVIGYAHIVNWNQASLSFLLRVHPAAHCQRIDALLLALIEQRAGELTHLVQSSIITTWVTDRHFSCKSLLQEASYTCIRSLQCMQMLLREAPPVPVWPKGIMVRPFLRERDGINILKIPNEVFQEHWGYHPGALEEWYDSSLAGLNIFDPSLWFLAMDGEHMAGVCLCNVHGQMGSIEILAVRQPWQRCGLGMALLRHAFGEYYRRGFSTIVLLVDVQNPTSAHHLYERAGMQKAFQLAFFEKDITLQVASSRLPQY